MFYRIVVNDRTVTFIAFVYYTLFPWKGKKKKIALIEQTEGDIFIGKVVACRNLIRRVRACKLAKLGQLY